MISCSGCRRIKVFYQRLVLQQADGTFTGAHGRIVKPQIRHFKKHCNFRARSELPGIRTTILDAPSRSLAIALD
jgi:hypothetical protein